jgi:hypothetical protein
MPGLISDKGKMGTLTLDCWAWAAVPAAIPRKARTPAKRHPKILAGLANDICTGRFLLGNFTSFDYRLNPSYSMANSMIGYANTPVKRSS